MRNAGGSPSRKPRVVSDGASAAGNGVKESDEPEGMNWFRSDTEDPAKSDVNLTAEANCSVADFDHERKIF
jgi:hypothetical protein